MGKARNSGGRPSKMTGATVRKLEWAFANGFTATEAVYYAKISRETLYDWMRNNPGFSDRITALRSDLSLHAKFAIAKAINEGDVKAAWWYLVHKRPEEFGPPSRRKSYKAKQQSLEYNLSDEDKELIEQALTG